MPPKPSTTPSTQVTPSSPQPDFDPMLTWNRGGISETLDQDDDIHCPPPQLIHADPLQHSQHPFTVPTWEPQRTHFEITWQDPSADLVTPAPSEYRHSDETLSPIHLQRMVDNSMPMRLSPAHFPQLEDIAGSPVSSTVKPRFDCETGKFFQGDDLHEFQQLSPISSYHSFGPLPTPDFDSTGHVMWLGQPGDTAPLLPVQRAGVLPPSSTAAQRSSADHALQSPQTEAHPGSAPALPQHGENLEDFNEHQVNSAYPALSQTLHAAWQTLMQMQRPSTFQSVPGSAPVALYRSTAEQREFEARAALASNDAATATQDFPVVELVASQDAMQ